MGRERAYRESEQGIGPSGINSIWFPSENFVVFRMLSQPSGMCASRGVVLISPPS